MDNIDRRIVNHLQAGLPVRARPFDDVAAQLELPVDELLARLQCLLDDKVLSRFGPMYNAESMGGALSLCAMQVPPDRFDAVAAQVNAFAEVAHNYERDHLLNMWFVIATEHPAQAAAVIRDIELQTGCQVYDMPKQEEFFIGLRLAV
jgi:DNA-binding Lrp family transcriptional regulator